jgi:hypothetical protein
LLSGKRFHFEQLSPPQSIYPCRNQDLLGLSVRLADDIADFLVNLLSDIFRVIALLGNFPRPRKTKFFFLARKP